jgi:hypothetical protein
MVRLPVFEVWRKDIGDDMCIIAGVDYNFSCMYLTNEWTDWSNSLILSLFERVR